MPAELELRWDEGQKPGHVTLFDRGRELAEFRFGDLPDAEVNVLVDQATSFTLHPNDGELFVEAMVKWRLLH